ncbi:MAG: regulatory signaling modulator protein AmpE [Proteobacteria bacterium]|nr:regulatory signaling modulator protein AmpE [Pseudomonadota bacterium]
MAIVFVAIVVVLLLTHFAPDLKRLRNFSWLRGWQDQGAAQSSAELGLLITIGLPALLCLAVQLALRGNVFGLPSLVVGIVVLFYCMGPRDLEQDVEAVDKAPDSDRRNEAAQALKPEEMSEPLPFEANAVVEAAFTAGLRRVFGVVLWFAILGPVGALLYRLAHLLAYTPAHAQALPATQQSLAQKFARLLDWLPAHPDRARARYRFGLRRRAQGLAQLPRRASAGLLELRVRLSRRDRARQRRCRRRSRRRPFGRHNRCADRARRCNDPDPPRADCLARDSRRDRHCRGVRLRSKSRVLATDRD